jgi:hypothetical protein
MRRSKLLPYDRAENDDVASKPQCRQAPTTGRVCKGLRPGHTVVAQYMYCAPCRYCPVELAPVCGSMPTARQLVHKKTRPLQVGRVTSEGSWEAEGGIWRDSPRRQFADMWRTLKGRAFSHFACKLLAGEREREREREGERECARRRSFVRPRSPSPPPHPPTHPSPTTPPYPTTNPLTNLPLDGYSFETVESSDRV